jgi:hypothetical protein
VLSVVSIGGKVPRELEGVSDDEGFAVQETSIDKSKQKIKKALQGFICDLSFSFSELDISHTTPSILIFYHKTLLASSNFVKIP